MEINSRETVEAGNRLIAEFMGWESNRYPHLPNKLHRVKDGEEVGISVSWLEYHSSWDWLMPVVEKIESLDNMIVAKVWVSINGNGCGIWSYYDPQEVLRSEISSARFKVKHSAKTKIEATWLAVVDFIQWYSSLSKSKQKAQ